MILKAEWFYIIEVYFSLTYSPVGSRGALPHADIQGLRLIETLPFHLWFTRWTWVLPCRPEGAKGSCISHLPYSVSQNAVTYPYSEPRETLDPGIRSNGLGDGYTVSELILLIPETFT